MVLQYDNSPNEVRTLKDCSCKQNKSGRSRSQSKRLYNALLQLRLLQEWDATGYASDMSTLTAALKYTDRLSQKDFSAESCAARGYVTYADADGILHTVYSNQINVVDTQIV